MKVGSLEIPASSLIILARFYKTSVDYLLGITDERQPYKGVSNKIAICPKGTNHMSHVI